MPALGLGDLLRDAEIMTAARQAAQDLLARDPELLVPDHSHLRAYLTKNEPQQDSVSG
jgi:hypothetical protein